MLFFLYLKSDLSLRCRQHTPHIGARNDSDMLAGSGTWKERGRERESSLSFLSHSLLPLSQTLSSLSYSLSFISSTLSSLSLSLSLSFSLNVHYLLVFTHAPHERFVRFVAVQFESPLLVVSCDVAFSFRFCCSFLKTFS